MSKLFPELRYNTIEEHIGNLVEIAHEVSRLLGKTDNVMDIVHHLVYTPEHHTKECEKWYKTNPKDDVDEVECTDHKRKS